MKELFIIRHAKSSWEDDSLSDFDRPLNNRGVSDANLIGSLLNEDNLKPDLILSSPANRAITTANIIASKLGYASGENLEDKHIYEASYSTLMQLVNQLNDQFNRAFIVGHNPGFTYLAEKLGGEYIGNLPTCGVVGLRFSFESWNMIVSDSGLQCYYEYPKKHKSK